MKHWTEVYSVPGSNARPTLAATVSIFVKSPPTETSDLESTSPLRQQVRCGLATYIQPDILVASTDLFDDMPENASIVCGGKECSRFDYPTGLRRLLEYNRLSYLQLKDPADAVPNYAQTLGRFPLVNQIAYAVPEWDLEDSDPGIASRFIPLTIVGLHEVDGSLRLKRATAPLKLLPGTPLFDTVGNYVGISSTFLAEQGEVTALDFGNMWITYPWFTGRSSRTLMSEEMIREAQKISYF